MAKKFLTGLKLVNLPSDPAFGEEGELYFNTSASVAKIYKQGTWSELGSGAGGGSTITVSITAPVSPNEGDEWYKNDTGELYIYDGSYWVEINGTISASGALTNIDSITYPDYITFDTTPETIPTAIGSIYWDSGDGLPKTVLSANVELGIGQEQVALVKNATGSSIAKGKVVYINGAQGQRPTIALSDADAESTSSKTLGITAETIANEAEGFVTTFGVLRGVNTNGLTEGAALWLSSTAGGYTTTIPTDPAHLVFIGYVVKAHASSGEIFVNPQNGYELNELHDVLITSASVQQGLVLDSDGLWKNQYLVNSINGTTNQIDVSNNGITDVVLSLPNELITPGNLTVTGNLIVSGSTTYINTETLNIEDNIILLNSNVSGSPTGTAGIEIERGSETNTSILWDESTQTWRFSNDIQSPILRNPDSLQIDSSASIPGNSGNILLTTDFSELEIASDGLIQLKAGDSLGQSYYTFAKTYLSFPDLSQQTTAFLGMSSYDTDDLSEGSNLYFTDVRAVDALASTLTSYLTISSASNTYQPLDSDLTSISGLSGTSGFLITDGSGNWSIDQSSYLTQSSASSIYLTQIDASSTYLTQSSAASTYATQSSLSSYLTNANAALSYQPLDADLTTISSLSGSAGFLTTDGLGNWSIDINSYAKSIEGTIDEIEVSESSGLYVVGLPDNVSITNNLEVGGNLNVSGSISYQNELVISDPLIYIGEDNNADVVDLGIVASFTNGTYQHTGIVRDATDEKWKLFKGVEDEPTSTINFDQAEYSTLVVGKLENVGQEIVLNSMQTSGSVDASLVVERGSDPDVSIRWNETTNKWQYTNDGSTYTDIGSGSGGGGSAAAAVTSDPPSSPELNQVWQDLDTGRIYVWDGTFWIEVQQNGSLGLLRYLGASSTAPTTSVDGSALQVGEVYFDTTYNVMKVYNGSSWQDSFTAGSLSVNRWKKTVSGGETSLSGNDDSSISLSYVAGIEEVYLNGVKLIRGSDYIATTGTTITNLEPLVAGSVIEVISYSGFTVANTYTKTEVDNLLAKQGVRWTKVAGAGTSITVLSGSDDYANILAYTAGSELVYVNGILIARGTDYTASNGSSITLASALSPGDIVEVIATSSFSVANTYTKAEVDNKLLNYIVCTSTTRPASPTIGQKIYETDKQAELTWNGSIWTLAKRPGEIIESVSSPCDGSTVNTYNGSLTFQNVTAAQACIANVFNDTTGSIISYTPPPGTTRVRYIFNFAMGWDQDHAISYHKFYIDGVEVTNAKHNRSGRYPEDKYSFEWTIAIGGTANPATGRQASWTSAKQLKMMSADYGDSNSRFLHSGNYGHLSGSALSQPVLTIEAIA